jgi:hypothetical protein
MVSEKFIIVGLAFNLTSYVLYMKSVIKGQAKPNLISWFVWMLAPFIAVFFQLKAGARFSVLPVFMAGFGPLIIMITAALTKNAFWKVNALDIYCGILSVIALVCYILTHNLGISIIFAILSDGLAFIPTATKSWNFPETESSYVYSFSIISNTIGLLIIKDWSFTIYSFGIYLIAANIIMTSILFRKKITAIFA